MICLIINEGSCNKIEVALNSYLELQVLKQPMQIHLHQTVKILILNEVVHIGGTVRTYNPFIFSALHADIADVDALDL